MHWRNAPYPTHPSSPHPIIRDGARHGLGQSPRPAHHIFGTQTVVNVVVNVNSFVCLNAASFSSPVSH